MKYEQMVELLYSNENDIDPRSMDRYHSEMEPWNEAYHGNFSLLSGTAHLTTATQQTQLSSVVNNAQQKREKILSQFLKDLKLV